ncbi:YybH family protein [Streptomyces profundus]|uniref:YybH family protein n=1 Tax=Streptomyces profundus TaxID=2867410 RepID=UPI001D16D509|nr:nuclear transport factor 2 family protein [Streptomyces sp. MA3_2.13]UED84476.1 nuclear transport factor 2 family protein [Streptomyces sp. MA3_2.13]
MNASQSHDSPTPPRPLPLAREPERVPEVFASRFNSGDAAALDEMYAPDAAFVTPEGRVARGAGAIAVANAGFLSLGRPIVVRPRAVTVVDDTALLVVDWELSGVDVAGTATDIARRGPDGIWRYLVDSPFGGGPLGDGPLGGQRPAR